MVRKTAVYKGKNGKKADLQLFRYVMESVMGVNAHGIESMKRTDDAVFQSVNPSYRKCIEYREGASGDR